MDSKIAIEFEISLIVVEAIRGRCASFIVLTATVSEIFRGQKNSSILVVYRWHLISVPSYDGSTRNDTYQWLSSE